MKKNFVIKEGALENEVIRMMVRNIRWSKNPKAMKKAFVELGKDFIGIKNDLQKHSEPTLRKVGKRLDAFYKHMEPHMAGKTGDELHAEVGGLVVNTWVMPLQVYEAA